MSNRAKYLAAISFSLFLSFCPGGVNTYAADYFSAGVKLFDSQRFEEAGKYFKHVLSKNPRHIQAIYYLGASLQNSGDISGAISYYSYLLKHFPKTESAGYARKALEELKSQGYSQSTSKRPATRSSRTGGRGDFIPDSETVGFKKTGAQEHPLVNVRVNGRNLQMIFDTGSTICLVGKNHLQQVGIAPPAGPATNKVKAVGGVVDAWEVKTQMALGNITRTVDLVVIDTLKTPLLGQSFYGDLKYEVDNARGVISFKKPGGKGDFVPSNTIDIPLKIEGNDLVVIAKVNGRPMPFFFDTGASASIMTFQELQTMGDRGFRKIGGTSGGSGASGSIKSQRYEVDMIELGPIRKHNLVIAVSKDYNFKYGLLGRDFFGNRRFVVDRQNKVVRFHR